MTSRTPSWPASSEGPEQPGRHPDVDLLADLAEELADPADAPALRRHLDGCPECADTFAALAEVRDLLGATGTLPMPTDIAERIDAALAAEAAPDEAARRTSGAPRPRTAATGTTAPKSTASKNTPPRTTPAGRDTASTGPGRTRRRRGRMLLGAASLVAVVGLGTLVLQLGHPGTQADRGAVSAAAAQSTRLAAGAPVFTEAQLTEQIHQLLSGAPSHGTPKADAVVEPRNLGAGPTDLPSCVLPATGHGNQTPLTVGHGRYGAAEVAVVVFPIPGQPGQLDVYLVSPSCPGATVLLHRTVPAG